MFRIRSSLTPACGQRGGRRSCCASLWRRSAKEGSLRPQRPRATSRESAHGRSAARFASGSVGCRSMPGGWLGRWRCSSRATFSRRRDSRSLDEAEAADAAELLTTRGDPRVRPAADVHPPDRPQRYLLRAHQRRARTRPPSCRPTARRAAGRERARRRAPADQRAGRRWLGRRAARRGRARGGPERRSRVGSRLPAPSAR